MAQGWGPGPGQGWGPGQGYGPPPGPYGYGPAPMMNYGPPQVPMGCIRCPYCGWTGVPLNSKKTATAGWVLFAVLLILFFPLCWIGLLIQETRRKCGGCQMVIGG